MSYKEKDFVYRMILKENETLKKALKEKGMLPDTTQSMLSILDLQRDRIFVLEEENNNLEKINEQLKDKLKDFQMKFNDKSNNFDVEMYQKKCEFLEKKIKEITSDFSKKLFKYKSKLMELDAEAVLNDSVNIDFNEEYGAKISNHKSTTKKKSLDPLKMKK